MNDPRFWAKVSSPDRNGCMIWLGAKGGNGSYGRLTRGGKGRYAHRWSWQLANGPIPEGLVIDHICRTRLCVNPKHLRAVTNKENLLAEGSQSPAKLNKDKTHCDSGHDMQSDFYISSEGHRRCGACVRMWSKKHRETKRAKDSVL